jgi:hypothetical protein
VSDETVQSISLLQEARPKINVVFWIDGTMENLGLKNTDYFQVYAKNPQAQTVRMMNTNEEQLLLGFGNHCQFIHVWSPSAQDPNWQEK